MNSIISMIVWVLVGAGVSLLFLGILYMMLAFMKAWVWKQSGGYSDTVWSLYGDFIRDSDGNLIKIREVERDGLQD